jgi:predicted Zn-ribbon and HTH transcriptional regulator
LIFEGKVNYGGLKAVPITGYDKVKDSHIKNKDSKVPLKCNRCGYEFEQSIHGHIKNRNGCKRCAGKLPWTLQLFLAIALTVHEKKYDYSAITEGHIKGVHAMVPVRCRLCDFKWSVSTVMGTNGWRKI